MTMLSNTSLEEKAELIFDLYDFDGSKYISRDELVVLMTNALSCLNAMSKRPRPTVHEIENKTDRFFRECDTNSDERITLKEFKSYIKKDPEILELLFSFNIAKTEDLGANQGGGDIPEYDSDLEREINGEQVDEKRAGKIERARHGIEFNVEQDEDGSLFEVQEQDEGDQFMAVKPWVGVINNSVPSDYTPSSADSKAPDANLDLEFVYGYRCHDTRNNLRYLPNDHFVFHTAALGIVMDPKKNSQKFHFGHKDDVRSIAVHPDGQYVATGEVGPKPLISIWDVNTMESVATFNSELKKGVMHLEFSNSGRYLAATAQDDEHCLAVYDWNSKKKKKVVASGKGTRAVVFDICFDPQEHQVVLAAAKEVTFCKFSTGSIVPKRGTGWGKSGKRPNVLCCAYIGNQLITGVFSGDLLVWQGTQKKSVVKAHTKKLTSIYLRKAAPGFLTGGDDGKVLIWNDKIQVTKTIDITDAAVNSFNPKVMSVCENDAGNKVLVGTRGGEVIEFTDKKSQIHLRSHSEGELWGLSCHPTLNQFFTVGQESMLAIWDITQRRQLKFARLDCPADCVEFSRDAKYISVGYQNGQVTVLDADTFAIKSVRRDRKKAISEIKFNRQVTVMAVGAHDQMIFLYNVEKNFKPIRKLKGHSSTITHIDWTDDGENLKSVCQAYEILFFSTKSSKNIGSGASAFKDELWFSNTSRLGWHQQGIWPTCADGSDINSVDRSPNYKVLASADDFGFVKLFKYPCPVDRADHHKYPGHSSHVTKVRFHHNIPYLLSTGGNDKAIFQWKFLTDDEIDESQERADDVDLEGAEDGDENAGLFDEEEVDEGDQMLCYNPLEGGNIIAPSDFEPSKKQREAPDSNLSLKHAFGFRSFDTRQNLKYLADPQKIAYTTAALGVTMDKDSKEQAFFNEHDDDVVCMDIHPERNIIVTGQMARVHKAKMIDLNVWDASTFKCLANLNSFHLRAIRTVQFSPDGSKIVSTGEDDDHSVAVWDWKNSRRISSGKVDKGKVYASIWKNDSEFVTIGTRHAKFWTVKGTRLDNQKGLFSDVGGIVPLLSGVFAWNKFYTGTSKGHILEWSGRKAMKKKHQIARKAGVWALTFTSEFLVAGADDGTIHFLTRNMRPDRLIDLKKHSMYDAKCGPRAFDWNAQLGTLLVGTRAAEIMEIDPEDRVKKIMQGHFNGEVWGCATHPTEMKWVSCGGDKTIRVWNETEMVQSSIEYEHDLKAADWSSDGQFIVVGGDNGMVYSVDVSDLNALSNYQSPMSKKSKHAWIEDIKISPDNSKVVFGTHGGLGKLEILKVQDGFLLKKMRTIDLKYSSAILHLDWDTESKAVISNSQGYEVRFADVDNGGQIDASGARDIEWATNTCKISWYCRGIFPGVDLTDVNIVCQSKNRQFMATGEDSSLVKLFNYPASEEGAQFKEYKAHSSHVTEARFAQGDSYLITTGGNDKTVLVWETDWGDAAEPEAPPDEEVEEWGEEEDDDYVDDDEDEDEMIGIVKSQEERHKMKNKGKGEEEEKVEQQEEEEEEGLFQEEAVDAGDEFMSVQPWKGQIKPPTDWRMPPKQQKVAPYVDISLEWVHGYRARDSKNNIGVLENDTVAYHAAAVGIVYDKNTHTQKHFIEHKDDITAISFHPDRRRIVTGEIGPRPLIIVWDGTTNQEVVRAKSKLKKGIQALSFSPSGDYFVAVAIDTDHHVGVFDTESGAQLAMQKGDGNPILACAMSSDREFATSGVKNFKFWQFGAANQLKSKKGSFGIGKNRYNDKIVSMDNYGSKYFLTGTIKGDLIVWTGSSITKKSRTGLFSRPLDAIHVGDEYIYCGDRAGNIKILNDRFEKLQDLKLDAVETVDRGVNAFCCFEDRLIVGTRGSEVFEYHYNRETGQSNFTNVITHGHYSPSNKDLNEVWGLTTYKNKDQYITVSDDATMRVWDLKERKQIKCVDLNVDKEGGVLPKDPATREMPLGAKARSVDVDQNGKVVAVGFRDGSFRAYNTENWLEMNRIEKRKEWIQDIKFSPDSRFLAVSSHDNKVDVYSVNNMKKPKAICGKSSSFITQFDWSVDSSTIQTNDGSYEILYYDAESGSQDTSGASNYKDEHWSTWTCILGWPVQGIWDPSLDGSDINSTDRSNNQHRDGYYLLAIGDDLGKVKVFRYPCVEEGAESVVLSGHSSHVTKVKFTRDDTHLISAGGNDTCIFQWKVTNKSE